MTHDSKGSGNPNYKHGMRYTRFYKIWLGIKSRCLNKNDTAYHNYGGRGIRVCKKWLDFTGFREDMFATYFKEGSIERINNNGSYCKKNCKWIPLAEQARNSRNCRHITFRGKTQILIDWARELDINYQTLHGRIHNYKWSIERALTKRP